MADIEASGGIKTVMKNLEDYLKLDRISVNGNLKEVLKDVKKLNNDVIRSVDNPYYNEG